MNSQNRSPFQVSILAMLGLLTVAAIGIAGIMFLIWIRNGEQLGQVLFYPFVLLTPFVLIIFLGILASVLYPNSRKKSKKKRIG